MTKYFGLTSMAIPVLRDELKSVLASL